MSLLEQLRKRRNGNSLNYYQTLVNRGQKQEIPEQKVRDSIRVSRHHDIKVIDKNRENLREMLVKTDVDRKKAMEKHKAKEPAKTTHKIGNVNFDSMVSGLHDAKNKKQYISSNADNFKILEVEDQRKLFKIFLDNLEDKKEKKSEDRI